MFLVESLGFILLLELFYLGLDVGGLLVVAVDVLLEDVALLLDGIEAILHLFQLLDVLPLHLLQGHCPINLFLEVFSVSDLGISDCPSIDILSLLEIYISLTKLLIGRGKLTILVLHSSIWASKVFILESNSFRSGFFFL